MTGGGSSSEELSDKSAHLMFSIVIEKGILLGFVRRGVRMGFGG